MIRQVMIIDDDEDDREIFSSIVEQAFPSISLSIAKNGQDALDQLHGTVTLPDIIFLDLNMPVMNGRQFMEEIKTDTGLHKIPVVVLTTSSDSKSAAELKKIGAHEFITKPDKFTKWEQLLQDFLQHD